MGKVKKMFIEFKSIFLSEDILKENESHANVVVATTMLNLFWISLIVFGLVYFNVFKVGTEVISKVLITNIFLLAIPAFICLRIKGSNKWMRIFLFVCFILAMAIADSILKYNVTLIMILPIVLAARYYNKKLTIWVSAFTCIAFIISTGFSIKYGQQDLNSYNLIIPQGTRITVNSTLRDSVTSLKVDEGQRIKNIYIHQFIPKLFIFGIVSFACVQISQSGKKMIEKQIEITDKSSRINTELNLAYNIQQGMLPKNFSSILNRDDIDIYAMSTPAKEVGGDFYDVFLIDEKHLAICMADVSGKGIPAALFMMISKILIKVIADEGGSVKDVITRVNNILSNGNELGLFVTVWLGIIDLETGLMKFVNAGHNPPFIYSNKTGRFNKLITKQNFILAGMKDVQFEESEYKLDPGDRLFLYTDGVVEAINQENKMYGEDRLNRFLDQNLSLNSKDTIIGVKKDIDKFANNKTQFDDMTMLELRYKDMQERSKNSKRFKADLEELPYVQDFVNTKLSELNINNKTINQIDLAVEEIFVNIVQYAYKDKEGICTITINNAGNIIEFTFEDNGAPFNPLEKEMPDITLSKDERDIGGLGIFLIKKTMDKVDYKYEDNKNILKITKIIKKV